MTSYEVHENLRRILGVDPDEEWYDFRFVLAYRAMSLEERIEASSRIERRLNKMEVPVLVDQKNILRF